MRGAAVGGGAGALMGTGFGALIGGGKRLVTEAEVRNRAREAAQRGYDLAISHVQRGLA